jgi:UDP-glucose:(heptosyl)LPS alpha-1,3-glucosyltransferase
LNPSFLKAIGDLLSQKKPGYKKNNAALVPPGDRPLSAQELLGRHRNDASFSAPADERVGFKHLFDQELSASLTSPFKQRLRIAVMHRNFDPKAGGAEHYAVALVEALAQIHEFHVFSQRIEHEHPLVTYHRVPQFFVRPRWLNQLLYAVFCAFKTRRGFDVVHSHENTWCGDIQTVHVMPLTHNLFAGKNLPQKTLQLFKVLLSPRLLTYVLLEKLRFKNRAGRWFVAVSAPLNQLLKYSMKCSEQNVITISPGVSVGSLLSPAQRALKQLTARARLGLPEQGRLLLWVGHDAQKKGLDTALRALSLLPNDYHLVIAGAAKPREFWAPLILGAQGARVQGRWIERGALSAEELGALYSACDLLIHPTREDTYGMVVLEAMAQGLPVIVSGAQFCGISAELTDRENALLLGSPEDAAELAGKVVLALQGLMADALSSGAQAFAQSKDWAQVAELQNTVYMHLAQITLAKMDRAL